MAYFAARLIRSSGLNPWKSAKFQLINQLRDKKLQKKKQKEILDEFITTQEVN